MTEAEYIEATNLAKLRIAAECLQEVLSGYGAVKEERLRAIASPLASLIDDCYAELRTDEPT